VKMALTIRRFNNLPSVACSTTWLGKEMIALSSPYPTTYKVNRTFQYKMTPLRGLCFGVLT
jgi:hypothetical protein